MRLPVITVLFLGMTLLLMGCEPKSKAKIEFKSPSFDTTTKETKLSLEELSTSYKSLQAQQVETEGIVWFEFENVSICPSRNSISSDEKQCFWLDFQEDLNFNDSLMRMASGKQFLIKGTIDTSQTGHLGMYLGTIKDIYFMQQK